MSFFPSLLQVSTYDRDAFLAARSACETALHFLEANIQARGQWAHYQGISTYLRDVLELADADLVPGEDLPAKKPGLMLVLEPGVRGRMRLVFALTSEDDRHTKKHGAVRSSISRSKDASVFWDTGDQGYAAARQSPKDNDPMGVSLAVGCANRLLAHSLARVAHLLSSEYKVELHAPAFLHQDTTWASQPTTRLFVLNHEEPHHEAIEAFLDVSSNKKHLVAVATHGKLARLVRQGYEKDWSQEQWDRQVAKHDLGELSQHGWAVVSMMQRHVSAVQWNGEAPLNVRPENSNNFQYMNDQNLLEILYSSRAYVMPHGSLAESIPQNLMALSLAMGLAKAELEDLGKAPAETGPRQSLAWKLMKDSIGNNNGRVSIDLGGLPESLQSEAMSLVSLFMAPPKARSRNRP